LTTVQKRLDGRNPLHAESRSQRLVGVDVDLRQDDHRDLPRALDHLPLETRLGHVDRHARNY